MYIYIYIHTILTLVHTCSFWDGKLRLRVFDGRMLSAQVMPWGRFSTPGGPEDSGQIANLELGQSWGDCLNWRGKNDTVAPCACFLIYLILLDGYDGSFEGKPKLHLPFLFPEARCVSPGSLGTCSEGGPKTVQFLPVLWQLTQWLWTEWQEQNPRDSCKFDSSLHEIQRRAALFLKTSKFRFPNGVVDYLWIAYKPQIFSESGVVQ